MIRTIKARFRDGFFEPLEKLEFEEGEIVSITVTPLTVTERITIKENEVLDALRMTAGAWKGSMDPEGLKRSIYSNRLLRSRPEPKL
jgi:predicted DNA-binding antitoxin AbrB/MazE fold protein